MGNLEITASNYGLMQGLKMANKPSKTDAPQYLPIYSVSYSRALDLSKPINRLSKVVSRMKLLTPSW